MIIIYRKVNMDRIDSKYHIVSVICLIISISTIIPSFQCLDNSLEVIPYLLFTIVLTGIEIYRLIKDNHKKREWIIYLSFLFNTFAFITIFINLIYKTQ